MPFARESRGEVVVSRLATFVMSLALLVGVILEYAGYSAHAAYPARVRPYEPLTLDSRLNHVVVIGDSYTTGTDEGGLGPKSWTALAWRSLAARGVRIAAASFRDL